MSGWLWFGLSVGVYFTIGIAIANRDLPKWWARKVEERGLDERGYFSESRRRHAREDIVFHYALTVLFWWVMKPVDILTGAIGLVVDAADPVALREDNKRLRDEIARLEREAGIR